MLKVIIISLILVAFIALALGIKMLFDPKAEFTIHSCALDNGDQDKDGVCSKCHLKDLADCPENKKSAT
jgi:hypothetical protein